MGEAADDELERDLRRRMRQASRPRRDDAPTPDEPYDWQPRPTIDHPRPRSSSTPSGRGRRPAPPRTTPARRRQPASFTLPSLPSGMGDVTGGVGDLGWMFATTVVGLSLLYLLLNEKGNGPRGFSALLNGATTGVRLLVEPVDPLAGAGALQPRRDPNQAQHAAAARHAPSRPVGTTPIGQAHNPTRGT